MPTKQPTRSKYQARNEDKVWSEEEQAAMQESARERKAVARRGKGDERAEGEADLRAKIAEMPEAERGMAERIHAIITDAVPALAPKTYYGMPAWARDGKIICFFQPASKFKVRYSTFGFQPDANLDDGDVFPIAWAITRLSAADEKRIAALVKKAVS
jgi:hypothetical protein